MINICGIAAIISYKAIDNINIRKMREIINHRGPDGFGEVGLYNNQIWLGHRRLSIIDLTINGKQPMTYNSGQYWIVYNGEIYNFVELRCELEKDGYSFITKTDTEVILAAYKKWGKECLSRFNGMWAFIIVDNLANKLFLARDRFGVKPLYYWFAPGFFALGSEIKQFTVLPGWRADLHQQMAYDFLNFGLSDHTSSTMYKNVYQLKGGEALEIDINQLQTLILNGQTEHLPIYKWYQLKANNFDGNFMDAGLEFKRIFDDAVKLRLRADVPVGTCLSGGLDSSSIVCTVNNHLFTINNHQNQKTFSVCSTYKKYDERDYIDEVIRTRKIDAHYLYPQLDTLFGELDKILWHQDEPFGSTSIYAEWSLFKMISDLGVKVTLDGHGADELLGGYHGYFYPYLIRKFKDFRWIQLCNEVKKISINHGYTYRHILSILISKILPERVRQPLKKSLGHLNVKPEWLNLKFVNVDFRDPYVAYGEKCDSISELSYAQLTATSLPVQLHWADRDSMSHSVESRLPFLDYRLVEFVLGLTDDFKLKNGVTKQVMREAMKDVLPEKICNRMSKLGFVTPEEVWIREKQTEQFRKEFYESIKYADGFFTSKATSRFENIINGNEPFDFFIWRVITFGRWLKLYKVNIA